jgi:hypothetical protein
MCPSVGGTETLSVPAAARNRGHPRDELLYVSGAFWEGKMLLGPAPATWQAAFLAQPRRLNVVTENAQPLTVHAVSADLLRRMG